MKVFALEVHGHTMQLDDRPKRCVERCNSAFQVEHVVSGGRRYDSCKLPTQECSYYSSHLTPSDLILSTDLITHTGGSRCVDRMISAICDCVCVRAPKGKRLELSTPNLVHSRSACIDPEVNMSEVKVIRLRQPSRSRGYCRRPLCCCCRRGTARRMRFLV